MSSMAGPTLILSRGSRGSSICARGSIILIDLGGFTWPSSARTSPRKRHSSFLEHCAPRPEAFHHYVLAEADRRGRGVMDVWRDQHIYPLAQFVGKSIVRLRTEKGMLVAGPDNDIYKGWTQALASADQLCKDAIVATDHQQRQICTVVLPVVVVPDGTLWTAEYTKDGIVRSPEQSDSTTLFLNHEIVVVPHNYWITLGHVHFFTLKGLEAFVSTLTARGNSWEDWFPDTAERYAPPVH
jgi:hypothetical protein